MCEKFEQVSEAVPKAAASNPYGPNPSDFLSNVGSFQVIESTLREGEQFANAFFTTERRSKLPRPWMTLVLITLN